MSTREVDGGVWWNDKIYWKTTLRSFMVHQWHSNCGPNYCASLTINNVFSSSIVGYGEECANADLECRTIVASSDTEAIEKASVILQEYAKSRVAQLTKWI